MFALLEAPIQLVPDGTLLFHLACILVMVALLNATLLKPINRVLAEREKRTKGRMSEAERALAEARDSRLAYERRLRETRAEGYSLMENERAAISREREQRVSGVRSEVGGWLSEEKDRIAAETERAKATLHANARSTAVEISQHILNRPIPEQAPGDNN